MKFVIIVLAVAGAIYLGAAYSWRKGFEKGADTALCLEAQQIDGPEAGMRTIACQHIKGRTPPPLTQWFADEPTSASGEGGEG